MKITQRIISVMLALCASASSQEKMSLSPYENATGSSPFLQEAFPQRTEMVRIVDKKGEYELVRYDVRIFPDAEKPNELAFAEFHWVVANSGNQIQSASKLNASFPATRPPDKREFLTFSFTVHPSLEKSTTINVGVNRSIRTYFTSYRLPLKSVNCPAVEQAGKGQPAPPPKRKSKSGDQPQHR